MNKSLQAYFETLDLAAIPAERRVLLESLSTYLLDKIAQGENIQLTFICTHNSRRSHLGQVWAQAAAAYYGVAGITTYSGGTETTACNPRTIAALERAGFQVVKTTDDDNPVYEIRFADEQPPIIAFSKVYDQSPNPTQAFAAIMTCSHAETNCPFIPGAERRIAITYTDPKEADDTPLEAETYDARCRQIATEMKYVFSVVTE